MKLQDTATWQNLNNAFNAEARAARLYDLFAECAREEGHFSAAQLFSKTAENERAHAKIWFRQLFAQCPDAVQNLLTAAEGEHFEWTQMYSQYAEQARADGFEPLAKLFENVAGIERTHEQTYRAEAETLENGSSFQSPQPVIWKCAVCGYEADGMMPPQVCPVCGHGMEHYSQKNR